MCSIIEVTPRPCVDVSMLFYLTEISEFLHIFDGDSDAVVGHQSGDAIIGLKVRKITESLHEFLKNEKNVYCVVKYHNRNCVY